MRKLIELDVEGEAILTQLKVSAVQLRGRTIEAVGDQPIRRKRVGKQASLGVIQIDDRLVGSAEEAVIVDFWAEWCGPCKMIDPILEEIAQEQAGKIKVVKLNVDENQDTARRFDVMSIPTLIVFKDGQPAKKMIGAKGKGALLQDLAEFL